MSLATSGPSPESWRPIVLTVEGGERIAQPSTSPSLRNFKESDVWQQMTNERKTLEFHVSQAGDGEAALFYQTEELGGRYCNLKS